MGFVVYNTESTRKHGKAYKTEAAAKAAITRASKKNVPGWEYFAVADTEIYYTLIEKTVTRVNLLSGKEYQESVNTPSCCSPASETYWSM